jgi:hypothetical protein
MPFLLYHHEQVLTVLLRSGAGWYAGQTKQLQREILMGAAFQIVAIIIFKMTQRFVLQ